MATVNVKPYSSVHREIGHPVQDPKTEKILTAATEAFMAAGYAAASMDAVAKRAQVSKTTLYSRFPSKEHLFAACVGAVCDALGARLMPEMFDDVAIDAALESIGDGLLGLIWSTHALRAQQIVIGEASRQPDLARIFYDSGPARTVEMVTRFFQRAQAQGRLSVADPVFAARQFIAALLGHIDCELRLGLCVPPEPEERRRHVRAVVELFLTGAGGRS